jgi:transformation/transcription domain-associated protein
VRIVEEEPSYCTYGEAYEVNCSRYGKEADAPILHLKKRLAGPDGTFTQDPQVTGLLACWPSLA